MTDEKIVDLFFERNEGAIEACDIKYGPSLRSFGNRITSDPHTTEECVDDTYVKTWETVPPKNPRNYLFAYLSKILRNVSLDRIRAARREKRDSSLTVLSSELTEASPDKVGADADAIRKELSDLIAKFVSNLPEESRHIFTMRYFYMEDLRTISKRLVITEGKVKTVLHRTRFKLKLYLESYGYSV
ncbi:MAG: sigma-70 family RNA polymerase sigma factor [Clostridia bacterium]|nr:sigma-70 family RNA polymerase sigma factor [Clostridia bacterium]